MSFVFFEPVAYFVWDVHFFEFFLKHPYVDVDISIGI